MEQEVKYVGRVNSRVALNNIEAYILTAPVRSEEERDLALSMVRYLRNWGCEPTRFVK